MPPPTEQDWVTPEEAARMEKVDARTIRRWARDGKIAAGRSPGGRWRISFPIETRDTDPATTTDGRSL